MKDELILVGGGGHCKSCIDVVEHEGKYRIHGILDAVGRLGDEVLGYPVLGTDSDFDCFIKKGFHFLVTVGQIQTFSPRKKIFDELKSKNAIISTIVSPRAYVSPHAVIGQGTILMHDVLVNANAIVGENCILNTKSLVEHDVTIENHCHISTAAVVNGGVVLREGTFYGSNAVTKEYVMSAQGDFIKAGSVFSGEK